MSIDLVDAASIAAELRTFLRKEYLETIILSKKDIRKILDVVDDKIATSFRELNYAEKDTINSLVTIELMKQGIMRQEMPVQPEVLPPSANCPEPHLWNCYDGVATEVEVLEFLHALVRMLKPKFILETGTYLGYGAVHMALAQKKNGFGDILTCDMDADVLQKAITLALANDVEKHIQFVNRKGIDIIPQLDDRCLDMVFIDSGNEGDRIEEINAIMPKLSHKGLVAVHDTNNYFKLDEYLEVKNLKDEICRFDFYQTPRGLSLFYKR